MTDQPNSEKAIGRLLQARSRQEGITGVTLEASLISSKTTGQPGLALPRLWDVVGHAAMSWAVWLRPILAGTGGEEEKGKTRKECEDESFHEESCRERGNETY